MFGAIFYLYELLTGVYTVTHILGDLATVLIWVFPIETLMNELYNKIYFTFKINHKIHIYKTYDQ